MTTAEKVAYLKGLMEGMELDTESGEGKLLRLIADVLGDLAEDVEDVESDLCELSEDVDAIGDAVADLEEFLDEDDDEDGEPLFFEFTCESCGKTITVDEDVLELGTIQCPECGEMMDLKLDGEKE